MRLTILATETWYGLHQIDEEVNIKIFIGTKADGVPMMDWKYGDINNMIKDIKALVKQSIIGIISLILCLNMNF